MLQKFAKDRINIRNNERFFLLQDPTHHIHDSCMS